MNINKNKKILLISSISLAVIIVLGIVYAAFTQQLNIAGSATGRSSKWDIHFENLSNVSLNGTAKELTAPTINTNSTQISNYSVSLTSPGDYVEYTFDVVNDGDYDATLTNLSKTAPSCAGTGDNASTDASNVCGKLTYTLTYSDGTTVSQNDTLASKETKTMKLKLLYQEFNDDSLLPKMDVTITGLGITLTYTQQGNAKVNADGTTPLAYDVYSIGDTVTIANETYYVIADSGSNQDYVTLLKGEPLTVNEINTYGTGHVNMYNTRAGNSYYHQAYDLIGDGTIGGVSYYTSANCGYPDSYTTNMQTSGCTSAYDLSEIKYIVDSWAAAKFSSDQLKQVGDYRARLIEKNEIEMEEYEQCTQFQGCYNATRIKDTWMYNSNYWYWTMSPNNDSSSSVWYVNPNGILSNYSVRKNNGAVRPVINVYKNKIMTAS